MASALRVDLRTVRRWEKGERRVPWWVERLLEVMARAACLALGRALQAYMRAADVRDLPSGVMRKHFRHHSEPDPMAGKITPDSVRFT